ncbi:hypothetical protein AB0C98_10510 [Streptomyces sp. NPDC048558]|uniref:hypothetical protein n=1 Tax=Streptomyces sp. NPDC048558 TaxID=3155759 RepID=UPI0033EB86F1
MWCSDGSAAPGTHTRAGIWANAAFNLVSSTGTSAAGVAFALSLLPLPLCFALGISRQRLAQRRWHRRCPPLGPTPNPS